VGNPFADSGPYRLASPSIAQSALDRSRLQDRDFIYPRLLISVAQVAVGLYLLLVEDVRFSVESRQLSRN
jgi:hypothetical protein